jgi:voltage-dependent potassium channel beta subunit
MKYRRMGKSGLKISEISLGAWLTYGGTVAEGKAAPIIRSAIESGINFIDISDIYSKGEAERIVGNTIKDYRRSDLVISSKLFWPMSDNINDRGLSRKHIMESIESTLKRIGTEYLDIYYCHRFDPETEVEETVRAMDDLVHQGKVLYWGTSVWEAAQIERAVGDALRHDAYLPSVEQPRYNMLDRHIEDEIMPSCKHHGMGLTVWSPLGQGLLTGKYNDGMPEGSRGATSMWLKPSLTNENIAKVKELTELAKAVGITMSQMALAWILIRDEISCAIIGATSVDQLQENIKASDIELDNDTLQKIDSILGTDQ